MNVSKVTCVYFSATGLTEKVLDLFLAGLPVGAEKINITSHLFQNGAEFGPDELVIFAAPVYGGVLPAPAAQRFERFKGRGTPAVCLAVYGNRDFDDALVQMQDLAEQNGFIPLGFAAAVAQHSLMPKLAAGRPDGQDAKVLAAFARKVWEKVGDISAASKTHIPVVPGNRPYRVFNGVPFKPETSQSCVHCGACAAHCPTGAISAADPSQTNPQACIGCMACVRLCPSRARSMKPKFSLWLAEKICLFKYGKRKETQTFM